MTRICLCVYAYEQPVPRICACYGRCWRYDAWLCQFPGGMGRFHRWDTAPF